LFGTRRGTLSRGGLVLSVSGLLCHDFYPSSCAPRISGLKREKSSVLSARHHRKWPQRGPNGAFVKGAPLVGTL
jgi:hypothetical protein